MTLTAAPVRQYSSFDLYKQGFSNKGSLRVPRQASQQLKVSSRPTSQYKKEIPKRTQIRISPKTIFVSILVVITFLAVTLPATTAFGGLSLVPAERQTADVKSDTIAIVVEEGDTLWSVANRIDPDGDPRIIVDQLASARGTTNLYAGEIIEWTK